MPGTDDLQSFIEEKLLQFDPDIDLSDGSPAQEEVVGPLVRRFTPDPFEMDLSTFIRTRLLQEYDGLSTEEGDALADLLIKPMEVLLDPIIREVEFLRKNKSLNDADLLSPEEADALMGNFFVSRTRGRKAVGRARLYFNAPTSVALSVGNEASTADGLVFVPSTAQQITAEAMLFNQDGNLFYFDASFEAETEGDQYNIDIGKLSTITNVPAAVKIANLSRFRDGLPEETTLDFVDRGQNSLTERSLVVPRGAISRLFDQFGELQHLQVVGFNDSEMKRDIIRGGGLGPVVLYGADGQSSDDGDGDGFSDIFESPTGGFIANVGAVGQVHGFMLTLADKDYPVLEVVSDYLLKVGAALLPGAAIPSPTPHPDMPDDLSGSPFVIRRVLLTISDIPGGIINPIGLSGTVPIMSDEVHIGGISDFYLRGTSLDSAELVVDAVSDESALLEGLNLSTKIFGFPDDLVQDTTVDFVAAGVRVGMTLVIATDAGNAGAYQIIKVAPSGNVNRLQLDPTPSSQVNDQKYKIVDEIDVDLLEPKIVRGSGTDLTTILGSTQVSTVAEVDFDQLGTEQGDTLRITGNTLNAGDYNVDQVTGTGNKLLVLGTQMRRTSSSESWQLFKKGTGIQTPLIRITSIDILDASNQPTGETIPYAHPIDVRSFAFSNIGVGRKKEVNDARIGIIGTVDLSAGTGFLNTKTLKISIDGASALTVTFSGVSTVDDVINKINTAVGKKIGGTVVGNSGEVYLCLRSRNHWISVGTTGTANALVGFSTTVAEDNRQIKSASVADWTDITFGLQERSDSIYILTGDNIEFWYFQELQASRLLALRMEDGKAIFPLPDLRASVRIGSRSFGKVRCYFLEPTSFEVMGDYRKEALKVSDPPLVTEHAPNVVLGEIPQDELPRTEFALDLYGDGSAFFRFFPDPALQHYVLPVGDESVPDNATVTSAGSKYVESEYSPTSGIGKFSRSAAVDFLLREVLPGDVLEITYQPIQGTVDLRDVGSGGDVDYSTMEGKTFIVSLENGPDRTVTFSSGVTDGQAKLVSEINNQLGSTIAFLEDTGTAKYLRLEADFSFTVRGTGTATTLLLGSTPAGNNDAKAKGSYKIEEVGYISGITSDHHRLTLSNPLGVDPSSWTGFTSGQVGPSQHFKIYRPGVQRVSSTEMQNNKEGSLYYADIELVSYGAGDEFNIDAGLQLSVEDHRSDGYSLYNNDNNLTFSLYEQPKLRLGRRMLSPGSTDSPENMTLISQQNIQVNYERSDLVEQVQRFALSELDRVLCANILVRHLVPLFVNFGLVYQGGSKVSVVSSDIDDLILGVGPSEVLESSAIVSVARRRGAQRVELPVTLVGVTHGIDRKITVERSDDAISQGRLSTFISDTITITRQTTS